MPTITPGRYRIHKANVTSQVVTVYLNLHPDHDPEDLEDLFVKFDGDDTNEEFPLKAIVADQWELLL
jgi:hypothetical protein